MRTCLVLLLGAILAETSFGEYQPEEWNLKAREEFAAKRFGVFIHWGLYANYAQGEWYLFNSRLNEGAYSRMIDGFCPAKFDAKEWVRIVKAAGAKYITITSRHHEGFSLWPTKVDDGYNVANTPFKRDILGELAAACKEAGIQLNFYYSLMDWHRLDYPEGSCTRAIRGRAGKCRFDYQSYKRFMLGQIAELLEYDPGNIWFDGEWDHPKTFDWEYDEIYDLIHSKKVLVANNNHKKLRPKEDIQLFERDLPGENESGYSKDQEVERFAPLEQCDVIQKNVWGYKIGEDEFLSPEEVCAMVVRAAAKNSNLLMNIGPDGSGRFPEKAVESMLEAGKWLDRNGDAVYGTKGGGLTKNADGTETAVTLKDRKKFVITIRRGEFPQVEIFHLDGNR